MGMKTQAIILQNEMKTRRLRRRSHWPFNRRWCVSIEQLVESVNYTYMITVAKCLCLLNKASKSQTFKDFRKSVSRLDIEFN